MPATDPERYVWRRNGADVALGVTRRGTGPTLLLLPALSSISTRGEMLPLQRRLSARFATVAVDWPGFGAAPRPACDWRPDDYAGFLTQILTDLVPQPLATVAAGHGAGLLVAVAARAPGLAGRLCLVAPTWRGPLPTMMGRRSGLGPAVAKAGDWPGLGAWLYRLNVNEPLVRLMARRHVYDDADWLTPARLAEKRAVFAAPGARHASIRFVTGELDPFASRDAFLAAARRVEDPMLVIYGAHSPRRSLAEMAALAAEPKVQPVVLPHGKLGLHEEYPDPVAAAIEAFCADAVMA